jgi:inorganic pyrophosphatase
MDLQKIGCGKNAPDEFNVVIEIPAEQSPVKYEMDKETGALMVDRVVQTSMTYPCNYGFIPCTLSDDGDPADVLVINDFPLIHGCVVRARAIGVLMMEDESGMDEKILAVPVTKINPIYANVNSIKDLPEIFLQRIQHFFESYKALEKGKWVKVTGWKDEIFAKEVIKTAIESAKNI